MLIGQHHNQSVNTDTFTCCWCHTVAECFDIVCIHMHGFIITGCFFGIDLSLKSLILIYRVIEFGKTVGYLFACHEKFKSFSDIRVVVRSSGKRRNIYREVCNESRVYEFSFNKFVKEFCLQVTKRKIRVYFYLMLFQVSLCFSFIICHIFRYATNACK